MSAVMTDQPTSNVAEFFTPGPGERLRAARLSMGYDLAKIASELHLTTPVVEALEADDFSDIGARVFVRGYLRNYARIVGMPVDSILRQFDEKWPDDVVNTTIVRQSPRLPADGGPSRGLAGAVSWLLLIGLVILFLMWWRGYLNELVPEPMRVADSTSETAADDLALGTDVAPSRDSGPDAIEADGSLRLPVPPSDLPVEDAANAAATDANGDGGNALALPSLSETRSGATEVATAGGEENAAVGAAATTPAIGDAPTPVVADAGGSASVAEQSGPATPEVVMSFIGPCWVDVRDSERKFKLFGEMPKGTRKVLGGSPPYKLVIGNAKAVEITIDGEPFDLTPYAKGNVARFTLTP
jgi:cytoskeleton protein RodZ